MITYSKIRSLLKKSFPEYKVSVRRVKLSEKLMGDCLLTNGRKKVKEFLIRINNELDEELAIETLLHEYGHVLAWHAPGDDHGEAWGRAYSKVYRAYLKGYIESDF